jgi:hypothetical protein
MAFSISNVIYDDAEYVAGGHEKITVSTTVVALTASQISPTTGTYKDKTATMIQLTNETDAIRYRLDGGVPTSDSGHLLAVNSILQIKNQTNIVNLRMLRVTNDAPCRITYFFPTV